MSDLTIGLIAFAIFFGVPMIFVGWCFWLTVRNHKRLEAEELPPIGDATETPQTLRNVRRANWGRDRENA